MRNPYTGKRRDHILTISLVGLILLCVATLIGSGYTDIGGDVVPVDKPAPVIETASTPEPQPLAYIADIPDAEPEPVEAVRDEEAMEVEPTLTYIGNLQIYGYTPTCKHCCGKTNGVTASGVVAEVGRTVAMKGYEFGTEIYIEGLGYFVVEDRGVGAGVVDVACEDHKACYAITGKYEVYLVEGGN